MITVEDEIRIFTSMKSVLGEPSNKPLVAICGWCPNAKEKTKKAVDAGLRVSHGMCPTCAAKFEAASKE